MRTLVWLISTLQLISCNRYTNYVSEYEPLVLNSTQLAYSKWRSIESKLATQIDSIIKSILPKLTESDIELSDQCSSDLLEVVLAIKDMKLWAFKLLDATGKPSGGEQNGRLGIFGSYQECLEVKFPDATSSRGQYCLLDLRTPLPPKRKLVAPFSDIFLDPDIHFKYETTEELRTQASAFYDNSIRLGLCVPSSCNKDDVIKFVTPLIDGMGYTGLVYSCETDQPLTLDTAQSIILSILAVIVLLNVLALFRVEFVSVFDPLRNVRSIMNCPGDGQLDFLYGFRVLSLLWIILSHSYVTVDFLMLRKLHNMEWLRTDFLSTMVHNAIPAADSFFFISSNTAHATAAIITKMYYSGFFTSLTIVKHLDISGFDKFSPVLVLLRRILRLMPSHMLVIGLTILLPVVGSGPLWNDVIGHAADNCRERWWSNMLFINNIFSLDAMCLPHSWYVSADFQCLQIIIPYFYLLYKFPTTARWFLGFLVTASCLVCGLLTYVFDLLPISLLGNSDFENFLRLGKVVYIAVYSRIGIYAMGVAMGTWAARYKVKIRLHTFKLMIGWAVSTCMACGVVFGVIPWNSGAEIGQLEKALFAASYRVVFGVSLCWVLFVCLIGQGGHVTRFLSWNGFKPLAKISYLAYLVHLVVMWAQAAALRGNVDLEHSTMIWLFGGHCVAVFLVSVGLKVMFESPVEQLTAILFRKLIKVKLPDVTNK